MQIRRTLGVGADRKGKDGLAGEGTMFDDDRLAVERGWGVRRGTEEIIKVRLVDGADDGRSTIE